ncbi:MAG: hypothetical protein AB1393_06720 [Candidatus Edwardsbacteria bacterium]
MHITISELLKAESYLLKAETIFKELGDKYTLIATYLCLSELQIKKLDDKQYAEISERKTEKEIEQALAFADKALKLAEEMDSKSRKADCYFIYGKILRDLRVEELESLEAKENVDKLIRLYADMDFSLSSYKHINVSAYFFRKAIETYREIKQKKSLADSYLEYAKMLKRSVEQASLPVQETSDSYFEKALEIYKELKLEHKIKEVEKEL